MLNLDWRRREESAVQFFNYCYNQKGKETWLIFQLSLLL